MCTLRPHAYVLRSPLCTLMARVLKLIQYILLNSCWLSIKNGAIWAFIAPALLVIFVSLFIFFLSFHLASPRLASPRLTSPHLTSPHFTSPHLTSPHLTLPYLTSPHFTSPYLTLPYLTLPYLTLPYLTSNDKHQLYSFILDKYFHIGLCFENHHDNFTKRSWT